MAQSIRSLYSSFNRNSSDKRILVGARIVRGRPVGGHWQRVDPQASNVLAWLRAEQPQAMEVK